MFFDAGLKIAGFFYLFEKLSGYLISINLFTGKTKIEIIVPWGYSKAKTGMLQWENNIVIYSPAIDHLLIYDCLRRQIRDVKLYGMKADKSGFFYSNLLIDQDDFLLLPFKGNAIKRYGINGELKSENTKWCYAIDSEYGCNNKINGNIRVDSACITGEEVFFSLVYGKQNYLCKCALDQENSLCNIVYRSGDVVIRGVYTYFNALLFRRIFSDKTEIWSKDLGSDDWKTLTIGEASRYDGDIYGDIDHLKFSTRKSIFQMEQNDMGIYRKIYNFNAADFYISNGILFNYLQGQVIYVEEDDVRIFSIEDIVNKVKESLSYKERVKIFFSDKHIMEDRYSLKELIWLVMNEDL